MITKDDLIKWLREIDKKLNYKMTVIAVGGTALTLLNLKSSTRDVDFNIDGKDADVFRKLTKNSMFKVDIFKDGFIFSEQLPNDYIEKSDKIKLGLINIDLRALCLIDLILTKIARYNERDEEDIETIFRANQIDKKELERRFNQIKDTYVGREEDYTYHFNLILKRYLSK